MKKHILLFIAAILVVPGWVDAGTITRDDFLERLKQLHPRFQKEELTPRIEREEQQSYLGSEDWNLLSSISYAHEEAALATFGAEKTDAISASAGMEKTFWYTGGRLSANYTHNRVYMEMDQGIEQLFAGVGLDSSDLMPDSYYQNQLSVSYIQPLLKNRGGLLDRMQYDLKGYDVDFSEVQAKEHIETFLSDAAKKFLDWVLLTEQRNIARERLRLSAEALEQIRARREANLVNQIDVIRAEDAVRIAKQNKVLVESQWKAVQAELAVLAQDDKLLNQEPEYRLYRTEEIPSRQEAVARLEAQSRVLKVLGIRLEQLEHSHRVIRDTRMPDLSLLARVSAKNADKGFGESLEMDKPDALVGVQFRYPLGNRSARSQLRKADFQIVQLKKQIKEVTLNLVSALTNISIQIQEMENVLTLNQEQIESARSKIQEEQKLYHQGRGDLTFVIQAQDNEENAKLLYAQNAANYHKLMVEYSSLMDQLVE